MIQQPAFLIFGFGYLGHLLAEQLYQHGHAVRAVKRSITSDDIALPIDLDILDLNTQSSLNTWQDYGTWLFLLPPSQVSDYAAVLAHLTHLAEEYGIQHLIFSGSISVYGDEARICDEDSERRPANESARQILAVETLLRQSSVPNIDVLHLGGLYSAARHPVFRLLARNCIKSGQKPVNMLHQDRAVSALLQAALQPDGKRIRNVVETPHLTKQAFYTREAAKLGCPVPDFDVSDTDAAGKTVITKFS